MSRFEPPGDVRVASGRGAGRRPGRARGQSACQAKARGGTGRAASRPAVRQRVGSPQDVVEQRSRPASPRRPARGRVGAGLRRARRVSAIGVRIAAAARGSIGPRSKHDGPARELRTTAGRRPCAGPLDRARRPAIGRRGTQPPSCGMLATMRSEVVSSSNWSQGRIQATALYEPGLPGISSTSTLASRQRDTWPSSPGRRSRWR